MSAPTSQAAAAAQDGGIPFELRALTAPEVALLLGQAPRTVLEKLATRPDFPKRVSTSPATWVAGEVLAWREKNRESLQASRRQKRGPA